MANKREEYQINLLFNLFHGFKTSISRNIKVEVDKMSKVFTVGVLSDGEMASAMFAEISNFSRSGLDEKSFIQIL